MQKVSSEDGDRVFSQATAQVRSLASDQQTLLLSWCAIVLTSLLLALVVTIYSDIFSREDVSGPLLTGVITLFTISLTVATVGIQVASNRYSYRVDALVLQPWSVTIHFGPHILTMIVGVVLLSTGEYTSFLFFLFIFGSSTSILSVFPFLLWLLQSIAPDRMLSLTIEEIDQVFINSIERETSRISGEIINDPHRNLGEFRNNLRYMQLTEEDPVSLFTDIIRSRIHDDDTATTKRLLNRYVEHVEAKIEARYFNFRGSHSTSQHVSRYLFGPLETTFELALKNDNHAVAMEVVMILRKSVRTWQEKHTRGMPEAHFRIFCAIAPEYMSQAGSSQAYSIASEYSTLAEMISEDTNSIPKTITGPMRGTFTESAQDAAIIAINSQYYRPARVIRGGFRSIVRSLLRRPSGNAGRELVAIGLIGMKFAQERARSVQVVHIANEASTTNEAERTITTLVTFKDLLEEYGNAYAYKGHNLEKVLQEIDRINSVLEERDLEIASELSADDQQVVDVIRASRLTRGRFTPSDIEQELPQQLSRQEISSICDSLCMIGVFSEEGEEEYTSG